MNDENVFDNIQDNDIVIEINFYGMFKRFFDIFLCLVGLIPLIILIFMIKLIHIFNKDFDSIFFIQERIGINGKPFKMYKFRTMIPNADDELKKMLKNDKKIKAEYTKYKKLDNDPRITKVGKLLRKFSIDEVPQIINIIKGDMSLVGPRPYLFREKKDMGKYFKIVTKVKPGLTGYWQVNGRNNTDFKDRLKMDGEYVKIRSLSLDIKIFLKTFIRVIKRDGAK